VPAEADRRTLIRRLTFDLTGLPPTPEEVAAFVNDSAPKAYEKLVDRLLDSPHYGERWGRHWLDVVRYAETEGFEYDRYRPGAWRYRDYIIKAFNDDKPYDRFVFEQLAGDELDQPDTDARVAAGFNRLGPVRRNAGNKDVTSSRHEALAEMTDVIGTVFLGLTVGCARCHDHKFDPIPQADYYRLQAFFAAAQEDDAPLADPKRHAEWKALTARLTNEIDRLKQESKDLEGEAKRELLAKIQELQRSLPPPLPTISSVHDLMEQRTVVHVLTRGDPAKPGAVVNPAPPAVLAGRDRRDYPADVVKPRSLLARWITDPANPLPARVMANRIWQGHFGKGLVTTANDFGANGARPSHPELLDYLANELVAGGWQIKRLHRLIVTSSTYRAGFGAVAAVDPANRLLGRFPPRRLTAEEVRDTMLVIAGKLNRKTGGPSVIPPVDATLVKLLYDPKQWAVTPEADEHYRRSIYLIVKRNLPLPFGQVFDQPDAQTSCACREQSTHPLQALELLNGRLANELARAFGDRLRREAGDDRKRQIELAYELTASRPPTASEKELALRFLDEQPLSEFALVMFNINAFLYVR
jgi:hypothetical protein